MPIYEFECTACGRRFEELMRVGGRAPHCPACGEGRVERLLSTFVAGTAHATSAELATSLPGGGGCCGGSCGCGGR